MPLSLANIAGGVFFGLKQMCKSTPFFLWKQGGLLFLVQNDMWYEHNIYTVYFFYIYIDIFIYTLYNMYICVVSFLR